MNILVINGSPKGERSSIAKVTRAFLKGMAKDAEWAEAYSLNVNPCTGCFSCWNETPGKCVIRDDMDGLLEKMLRSDMVIWSAPQYCYGFPAPLKAVIDRMLPLSTAEQEVCADGRIKQARRVKLPEMMLISGCGFAEKRLNCEPLIMQFKFFFGEASPVIYCAQAPLLLIPGTEGITAPYLKAAERAGEEYAATGEISAETEEKLAALMLPSEIYRKMVNTAAKSNAKIL